MSDLKEIVRSLQLEYWYIHLVYHRNNNQHRKTRWWRQFNIFKRSINRILRHLNKGSGHERKKGKSVSLQDIVEGPQVQSLIKKFLKFQLPSIYREFQNVLTIGQFVTLAVVLIGLLARCRSLLLTLQSEKEREREEEGERERETIIDEMSSIKTVDEDLGMEVEIQEKQFSIETKIIDQDAAIMDLVDITDKKKSKKSKKKKKSAIDDIFG